MYLVSDAYAYTIGETICVDGGYHVLGMPQQKIYEPKLGIVHWT